MNYRSAVEKRLGRKLQSDEVVHHVNGDHNDDRQENLLVMTVSEHGRLHGKNNGCVGPQPRRLLTCPTCGKATSYNQSKADKIEKNYHCTKCSAHATYTKKCRFCGVEFECLGSHHAVCQKCAKMVWWKRL